MMSLCVAKFQYKILMKHHDHISSQSTSHEVLNRCINLQIYLHFFLSFWQCMQRL